MFCVHRCNSHKGEPVCLVQMLPPTPNSSAAFLVEFMSDEPAEGWLYITKSLIFFPLASFSSLSFILFVSEFTLNFIDQILQYNSYCTVCPFPPTTLFLYIHGYTVQHHHKCRTFSFHLPHEAPLFASSLLPFPPVLATTNPLSLSRLCAYSRHCIWMRIVFWLLSLSIMFSRFSLLCIIRSRAFFFIA